MSDDDDYVTCSWCGAYPLWPEEMTIDDPEKCIECEREECSHAEILRDYQGSNNVRARFAEHCVKCNACREVKVFFHNRYPERSEWVWD